jgi:hypothetical protein
VGGMEGAWVVVVVVVLGLVERRGFVLGFLEGGAFPGWEFGLGRLWDLLFLAASFVRVILML